MDEKDREALNDAQAAIARHLMCKTTDSIGVVSSKPGFCGPIASVEVSASGIGVDRGMAARQGWQQIHDWAEKELHSGTAGA
jgi:hypothetical protein